MDYRFLPAWLFGVERTSRVLDSSVENGWVVFLSAHPPKGFSMLLEKEKKPHVTFCNLYQFFLTIFEFTKLKMCQLFSGGTTPLRNTLRTLRE
jgi:hypothetical protein